MSTRPGTLRNPAPRRADGTVRLRDDALPAEATAEEKAGRQSG
jgi:hypothetical protein